MAAPKRHHYLPEAYLAGFTRGGTPGSLLYVFDRDAGAFRPQTPKNTAVQGHYYAVEAIDGARSSRAESILSKIEAIAIPIIRRIDGRQSLNLTEKLELAMFIALLYTRVPRFERVIREMTDGVYKRVNEREISSVERAAYWLRRHEEKTGAKLKITPEQVYEYFSAGQYNVVLEQSAVVRRMFEAALALGEVLPAMSWLVGVAPEDTSFITTDAPFVTTPPEKHSGPYGFGTPGAVTLVPLSQRSCLCIGGQAMLVAYSDLPKSQVREVNIALAQGCERFVIARDETLLRNTVAKSRAHELQRRPLVHFA